MILGDSDVEAWRKKEKMLEQIRFDGWISRRFDPFRDPSHSNWLQSVYPEYFEARVEENKALHELQAQFNTVQIRGPKSKEDLYLLYRVHKDPMLRQRLCGQPGLTQATEKTAYVRGLFNRSRNIRREELFGYTHPGDFDQYYADWDNDEWNSGKERLMPLPQNMSLSTKVGGGARKGHIGHADDGLGRQQRQHRATPWSVFGGGNVLGGRGTGAPSSTVTLTDATQTDASHQQRTDTI